MNDGVKKYGGYLLPLNHVLLIVFFILNGMNGFREVIKFREPFLLFLVLLGLAKITHVICRFLMRDHPKASMVSFLIFFVLLYARSIHSGINGWLKPARFNYSYYFPLLFLALGIVIWRTRKSSTNNIDGFRKYLGIALVTLSIYEAGRYGYDIVTDDHLPDMKYSAEAPVTAWSGASKPNIYFFLFDEYQGEKGLTKMTGTADSSLRPFLTANHFMVAKNPSSGFRYTFYSMASLFGMADLEFPSDRSFLDEKRIIMASSLIREENKLVNYLSANGYDIKNLSLFDLPGHPSSTDNITYLTWYSLQYHKTFPGWFVSDILHILPSNKIQGFLNSFFYRTMSQNEHGFTATLAELEKKTSQPRFIYAHFLQPRPPVFLDADGKQKNITNAMREFNRGGEPFIRSYVGYLKYTNQMIRKMVGKINLIDPGAVVLIASDHGLRSWAGETEDVFNIQLAMKLPGGQDSLFTDSTSLSNTFRIVLNHIAGQKLAIRPGRKQL